MSYRAWRLLRLLASFALWLAGFAGATRVDWLRWLVVLIPWLLDPYVWVALISVSVFMLAWDLSAWHTRRRINSEDEEPKYPDGHETDAAKVLEYLLNESKWSQIQLRRLNFRSMINPLGEFRRAALNDGLRTSGLLGQKTKPEPISDRHWIVAEIDPASVTTPHGVTSKRRSPMMFDDPTYAAIKVRSDDIDRIWPAATRADRFNTLCILSAKHVWYAISPDAWRERFYRTQKRFTAWLETKGWRR